MQKKNMKNTLDVNLILLYLQEECLAESFTRFIEHSLSLIRKQRDAFPVNNRQAMLRLDGMLQCLAVIYSLRVFKRTCPFQKELHPEVTNVIKVCHSLIGLKCCTHVTTFFCCYWQHLSIWPFFCFSLNKLHTNEDASMLWHFVLTQSFVTKISIRCKLMDISFSMSFNLFIIPKDCVGIPFLSKIFFITHSSYCKGHF